MDVLEEPPSLYQSRFVALEALAHARRMQLWASVGESMSVHSERVNHVILTLCILLPPGGQRVSQPPSHVADYGAGLLRAQRCPFQSGMYFNIYIYIYILSLL